MSKEHNSLQAFQEALLVRRVVARHLCAMEHPSEEALKKYLHEHPNADPSNHKVKKNKGPAKDKGSAKDSEQDTFKSDGLVLSSPDKYVLKTLKGAFDRATKAWNGSGGSVDKLVNAIKRSDSYKHNDPKKNREQVGKLRTVHRDLLLSTGPLLEAAEDLASKAGKSSNPLHKHHAGTIKSLTSQLEKMVKESEESLRELGKAQDAAEDHNRAVSSWSVDKAAEAARELAGHISTLSVLVGKAHGGL